MSVRRVGLVSVRNKPKAVPVYLMDRFLRHLVKRSIVKYIYLLRGGNSDPELFRQKGILPLGDRLNDIWEGLYSLLENFSRAKWDQFRHEMETKMRSDSSRLYRLKAHDSLHWGPFAMLVRESAFQPKEMGNYDYLRIPEIVDDICDSFKVTFGYNLADAYIDATKSYIVKFHSVTTKDYYIGVALYYLYKKYLNEPLSLHSNTCFDGMATKIEASSIISVNLIDYELLTSSINS